MATVWICHQCCYVIVVGFDVSLQWRQIVYKKKKTREA